MQAIRESGNGRRSFLAIAAQVLETCKPGARRTHVLYHANLNFDQLNKYLGLLLECELIQFEADSRLYTLTHEGRRFLVHYHELENARGTYDTSRKTLLGMLESNEKAE